MKTVWLGTDERGEIVASGVSRLCAVLGLYATAVSAVPDASTGRGAGTRCRGRMWGKKGGCERSLGKGKCSTAASGSPFTPGRDGSTEGGPSHRITKAFRQACAEQKARSRF